MPTSFLFEHSFNIANNFLSWGAATSGSGGFQGINDPTQLHFVSNDAISTGDDEVVIAVAMFAGQTINVDVDFGNGGGDDPIDLRGFVIDANGAFITQDDSGTLDPGSVSVFDPNFSFTATTSGVYFIALSHWVNNYNGDFQFENDGTDTGTFQVDISTDDTLGPRTLGTNVAETIDLSALFTSQRVFALGGADVITGSAGRNSIDAGDGNDTVNGGDSDDQVFGALGHDLLDGNAGNDVLVGGSGNDTLIGGQGNDGLFAGGGIDTASYADAAARVVVDLSNNLSQNTRGSGIDVLRGVDNLIGSQFNDWLGGTRFENRLEGGDGNDVLSGLNGDDTLIGGGGRDNLTGGSGEDVFVFNSLTDMGIGAMRDIITDFRHQIDTINLRGVDANSGVAGNQDFRFVGTSIFGGSAGELRVAVAGGNTVIQMDVNGDAVADAAIVLSGTPTVTAGDFLL